VRWCIQSRCARLHACRVRMMVVFKWVKIIIFLM